MPLSIATLALATTFIAGAALADVPHRLSGWASQSSTLRTPGPVSGFPFNSIESVVQLGERSLGVAIDTNFPGDAGRRAGIPDDTELIRIDFEQPLSSLSVARAVSAP
jgi:hypothetical protein